MIAPTARTSMALLVLSACLVVVLSVDAEEMPDIPRRLDARIPELMTAADVRGLTVAVVEQGELVWSAAYGVASAQLNRRASTETIFEAASLGKVVFALIVLRLADRGVIDLDESIATDFEYPLLDHDERFALLTPRLILQHASGLPNWGGYALAKERDPVDFRGDPGQGYNYSGEAYTALQSFVETRTGRSLEDLFQDLAREASMHNSSFISHATRTDQYAQAWRSDGSERPILLFEKPGAAYSLVSTAEDLARFVAFYFDGGGLSDAMFEESLRPRNPVAPDAWGAFVPDGVEIAWTLAWGVQRTPEGHIYFHGGNNGEFRSFFAYSDARKAGVALMANGAAGLSFLPEIFNPFIGDMTPAAVWWGYEVVGEGESPTSRR